MADLRAKVGFISAAEGPRNAFVLALRLLGRFFGWWWRHHVPGVGAELPVIALQRDDVQPGAADVRGGAAILTGMSPDQVPVAQMWLASIRRASTSRMLPLLSRCCSQPSKNLRIAASPIIGLGTPSGIKAASLVYSAVSAAASPLL
jgi:hypothetical protein